MYTLSFAVNWSIEYIEVKRFVWILRFERSLIGLCVCNQGHRTMFKVHRVFLKIPIYYKKWSVDLFMPTWVKGIMIGKVLTYVVCRGAVSTGAVGARHPSISRTCFLAPVDIGKKSWNHSKNVIWDLLLGAK